MNKIINQDCIAGIKELEDESVDIVVTSPPYNLNIDYGTYEDNLPRENYLDWLSDLTEQIKRVLKPNGHLWVNVGYSNIDPWVGMDVAQAIRKHYVLQNNFIWVKNISIGDDSHGHYKPINSERFSNPTWEHLFHFTKTGDIKCDKLAIGVPYKYKANLDKSGRMRGRMAKKYGYNNITHFKSSATTTEKEQFELEAANKLKNMKETPDVRCKGNTWYIPYETITDRTKDRGTHPATFPIALVSQCIRFSGIESGVLLDPFMGSGTSALGALKNNLQYIGYDIDDAYIKYAQERISNQGLFEPYDK